MPRNALFACVLAASASSCAAAVFCAADSASLAAALQASQGNAEDDTVRVVAGTHAPPGALGSFYFAEIGHHLTIEGGLATPEGGEPCSQQDPGAAHTVIDGGGTRPLLRIDSAPGSGDITLRNLTFRAGQAVGISAALELLGAGANTVTLENAIVQWNTGTLFQSMYYVPAVWLAGEQGGVVVRNVVFAGNDAPPGVWSILVTHPQAAGSGVVFNNVTVRGNSAVSGYPGVEFDVEGNLSIANGIFWDNGATDLGIVQNSGTIALDHNDIGARGGTMPDAEVGTLSIDPAFRSADDACLDPNSALRDAGDAAATGGIGAVDVTGAPRIAFASVDIGACEVPDDTLFRDGFDGQGGG